MPAKEKSRIVIEKLEPRDHTRFLDQLLGEHKEERLRRARGGLQLSKFIDSLNKRFPRNASPEQKPKETDDEKRVEQIERENERVRNDKLGYGEAMREYNAQTKKIRQEHEVLRDELIEAIRKQEAFAHIAFETSGGTKTPVGFIFSSTKPRTPTRGFEAALFDRIGSEARDRHADRVLHGQFVLVSEEHRRSAHNANRLLYHAHETAALQAGYRFRITAAPSDHDVLHMLRDKRKYQVLEPNLNGLAILGKVLVPHEPHK